MEGPPLNPECRTIDENDRTGCPAGSSLQVLTGSYGCTINSFAATTVGRDLHVAYNTNEGARPRIGEETTIENQRETILKHLKAPMFHGLYESALEQRLTQTGTWFLELPEFKAFLGSNGVTLWCTGMPGAGKTILASVAIKHLSEETCKSPDASLAFAFLRYSERYTWKDILASLLAQLIKANDMACTTFWPYCSRAVENSSPDSVIMESELEQAFCDVARRLERVYVVTDGLDEATDAVKDRLLETLVPSGVNLLILSRPIELYRRHAPEALLVSVQAETKDIELYVRGEVERSSRLKSIFEGKPDKISELCEKVTKQSEGMFLVAKLQMEAITRSSRSIGSLFRHLFGLPAGVNAMYDHILGRIRASEDASIAFRTLAWVKYAYPEALRAPCLQHGLSFDPETQAFDSDDLTPIPLILTACQGLVTLERWEHAMRFKFIHYTTSEYLESAVLDGIPNPHLLLAQTCLTCMEDNREWLLGLPLGQCSWSYPSVSDKPLLLYSHAHWAEHAARSSRPTDSVFPFLYPYLKARRISFVESKPQG